MKYFKKFFTIVLIIFSFIISDIIVLAGDDCMLMDAWPYKYNPYVKVDEFANALFADLPDSLIPEVKEWLNTDYGKSAFKQGYVGRNNSFPSRKVLSDKFYKFIGKRYGIPENLLNYFIISGTSRRADCYFDSFIPDKLKLRATSILASVRHKFHSEAPKILNWMSNCRKSNSIIPLDPPAVDDVD